MSILNKERTGYGVNAFPLINPEIVASGLFYNYSTMSFVRRTIAAIVAAFALLSTPGNARAISKKEVPSIPYFNVTRVDAVGGTPVVGNGCLLRIVAHEADGFNIACVGTGVFACPPVVPCGSPESAPSLDDLISTETSPFQGDVLADESLPDAQEIAPDYPEHSIPECDTKNLPPVKKVRQLVVYNDNDNCQVQACRGCLCGDMTPLKCPALVV